MTNMTQRDPKFTGKHMLALMLSFFAVILIANLVMVYFASKSWTGLLTKNSYAENQVFDKKTSQITALQGKGPSLVPGYKNNILSLVLSSAYPGLEGANIKAVVGRVVHERDDRSVRFIRKSPLLFEAEQTLLPGRWQLKLNVELPTGELWQKAYIIMVKDAS